MAVTAEDLGKDIDLFRRRVITADQLNKRVESLLPLVRPEILPAESEMKS